ncbi:transmembrane protein 129 isoform X2 [Anopheles aquasalis]|uniref:transmembrane protein 129 isoform X2 n=1 Tax=Anopheles aquasalis TaxID=42839 RepID=UPI00215A36BA|nr:transmembrane protein 129 isoform X2 [Anopheles aquasalis]
MDPGVLYTLVYLVLCFFIIFPTTEIESFGLTVDNLCSRYLTDDNFVQYHMKLATVKMLIHFTMPATYVGYMRLLRWLNPDDFAAHVSPVMVFFNHDGLLLGAIILLAALAVTIALYWARDGWSNDPTAKHLQQFTNETTMRDWRAVATSINDECRRITKMVVRLNTLSKLVVTENWMVEIRQYGINVAHQDAAMMIVCEVNTQDVITDTIEESQFVNITVHQLHQQRQQGAGTSSFKLRLNGVHYNDLRENIRCPVHVLPSVKFQSLTDRFVEAFREVIAQNGTVVPVAGGPIAGESCMACLQAQPDVKIEKRCLDVDQAGNQLPAAERCEPCRCRPHWCLSCLAVWFASRQERSEWNTWLSRKATCPMCRARFCVLDVCYLEPILFSANKHDS